MESPSVRERRRKCHSKVIFLRHGVRGFPEPRHSKDQTPDTKVPISPDPSCLLIASEENLSLFGHLWSFKLGHFIHKHYGRPDFVYADVTDPRTIDTSISLGRGCHVNNIFLSMQNPDPYFHTPKDITPETIIAAESLLASFTPKIDKIKATIQKIQPCVELLDSSFIDPKTANPHGLVEQEYVIGSTMLFAEDSFINHPLLKKRDTIMEIESVIWSLRSPTQKSIQTAAEVLLGGISKFLDQYDLSVIVGHEHNIIYLVKFLGLGYQIPEYPNLWINANSGFIFTRHKKYLKIEMIYLTRDHKFTVRPYAKIKIPTPSGNFELIKKTINYL